MQPSDRQFGSLPRHGVARCRGFDQIGACARRLVGPVACSGQRPSFIAEGLGPITKSSGLQTESPFSGTRATDSAEPASAGCLAKSVTHTLSAALSTSAVNRNGRL